MPTLALIFTNGLMLGAFLALFASRGLLVEMGGWLSIHGPTEFLALILSAAAGLKIAGAVLFAGREPRLIRLARDGRDAAVVMMGAVLLFLLAGLLEGLGRQLVVGMAPRYLLAGACSPPWSPTSAWPAGSGGHERSRPGDRGRRPRARAVVTPEGVAVSVRLASIGERVTALVLDLVILIAALLVVAIATFAAGGYLGVTAGILLMFVLRVFYFAGFELAWNGRTPGKRMTSLRVINRRGGPLTPAAVIARNLMREVELFLPLSLALAGDAAIAAGPWTWIATLTWVGVLAALPLFNRDRLRAGDMVAGTWVVAEPKPVLLPDLGQAARPAANAVAPAYVFTAQQLVVYGVKELQVLEEVLRSSGQDAAALHGDVARRIIRKIGYVHPDSSAFDARGLRGLLLSAAPPARGRAGLRPPPARQAPIADRKPF